MLYTFYGDDFTGSTDVLDALGRAGVPSALFLAPPTPEDVAAFPNLQALGIAGDARSRTPQWMSTNLPAIFAALKSFQAPITHYKTCSTFDSAPHIGSIGRALELGSSVWSSHTLGAPLSAPLPHAISGSIPESPSHFIPIVVGAPHLGRFLLFGTLFAAANGEVFRIDRHPTMSRHPVTPMLEPDLRRHLALQTALPIAVLDLRNLTSSALDTLLEDKPAAILFDTFDDASLQAAGRLIWSRAQRSSLFAVGSSGLTEGLIFAWRAANLIPEPSSRASAAPVDQILILSGSCSPVTEGQIEWALAHGFHGILLDPTALIADPLYALAEALDPIRCGRNPILYTALGPLAPATQPHSDALGAALGTLLRALLEQTGVRRTLLCGGDTSSHALQQLPLRALTFAAPLARGVPLCRAHAPGTAFHDAEFILKGGQVGGEAFFALAREGREGVDL